MDFNRSWDPEWLVSLAVSFEHLSLASADNVSIKAIETNWKKKGFRFGDGGGYGGRGQDGDGEETAEDGERGEGGSKGEHVDVKDSDGFRRKRV